MKQTEAYTRFASVYDAVMNRVAFGLWASYIKDQLKKNNISKDEIIADLGCGTGSVLRFIANDYSNILGIDLSLEMLAQAQKKSKIPFILADMLKLPFKSGILGASVCTHDTVNYLRTLPRLKRHFREVYRCLKPGGIYIFDTCTEKNVIDNYHNRSFNDKYADQKVEWHNFYDFKKNEITSMLIFSPRKKLLRRNKKKTTPEEEKFIETHIQRIYTYEQITAALSAAGFKLLHQVGDYNPRKKIEKAQLQVFIVKKPE